MIVDEIKKVVNKLIGDIHPMASQDYDRECLSNIEEYINLCDMMIFELYNISNKHKDSSYISESKVGLKATAFLEDLRDSLIEDLE